jgi:integrase
MASIIRRRGSPIWTAFFRDHTGRQHCISTKETDKRLALAIANEWEKAAWKKRSMRQTQKVIDRLHELTSGESIARLSVRQFIDSWLKTKNPETARSTSAFYRYALDKFLRFLGPRANLPITEITKEDLVNYRAHRISDVTATTANHDLGTVRMLFRAAKRDGLIADDPAEFLGAVKKSTARAVRRPFTVEELRAVFDAADPEWQSMILFGLYTGQRLGDIARLTWANLDLARGQVRLTTSKTRKVLIIPMADALVRHIEALPTHDDPHAPVHPRAWGVMERQKQSANLSNQFADLLAQAGLRTYSPHRSQDKGRGARRTPNALSFHSLRHTATSLMHEAGVPAAVVQAMIGHDSETMHQHYIGVGQEAMKAAANALPELSTVKRS